MSHLQDVLRTLPHSVTPEATSPDVVAADVARGHQALNRQRRQRFALSGAALAAVAVVAVGATQFGQPADTTNTVAQGPDTTTQTGQLQLVAYTGAQPVGFEVSTVPTGWQVVSSDATMFVVMPPGQDAGTTDPGSPVSLDGMISVALQGLSQLPAESPVTEVDINGRVGQLGSPWEAEGVLSDARWLIFPAISGESVLVQVPGQLGLTDEQVVQFAQGITVTADAESVGG